MGKKAGITFEKRQRERARQEKKEEKRKKRELRKLEKENPDPNQEYEDPDIAGIIPGPQNLDEEDLEEKN